MADGSIVSIDDKAGRSVPGVVDIVSLQGPPPGDPYTVLASGVAVVASSTWAAMQGRRALKVNWDKGPHVHESTESLRREMTEALNGRGQVVLDDGNFDQAMTRAKDSLEAEYFVPYVSHAPLEPQCCVVHVGEDSAHVIGPIQMPNAACRMVTKLTGIDRLAIKVEMTRLGGGFGRRLTVDYVAEATLISMTVKKPVKLQWSSEDDLQHDFYRPCGLHRLRAGVDEKGGWGKPLPAGMGRGIAGHFTFGGYAADVVEVKVDAGKLRVERVVGAIDCGLAVNPNHVIAQMESGVHDGLSTALRLQITIAGGQVQQRNFDSYPLASLADAPRQVETHIVPSNYAPSGVGEPPISPLAPALTNAIFAATGKRIRELPIGDQLEA